ncbi:DoxX family protein [Streptosporangium lutulentum]|uniref:Oxidoreductase n=1 Tax=Streptosporangium lutulentum TaxID=1461250 RepID=A0ABT9Q3C2_9ACTN|nr:DoxX family protein [Streptosporangium lutulentum]MDP9840891.1 putative oxidoreductase [Streptosporangium lutulentum]
MRRTLHDLASLAARLGVGGIFFANGWHKLQAGLIATGDQFGSLGAPVPEVWAATTMLTELIGGALLVAGLAVPACGLLLFAEAVAVFVVASGDQGLPLTGGDINLIVALGAASILLAVGGAGRLSVDHMVVIKRRDAEAAEDFAADAEADDVLASLREPETSAAPAPPVADGSDHGDRASERKTDKPEASAPDGPHDTADTADTAEFPAAARPRARTRRPPAGAASPATAPAPVVTPAPEKAGDTLVAGKKDESPRS